jgi:hypothetical protein
MNMVQGVQQTTLPTDANEKLLYEAKLLSCAAVTRKGLPYNVLTKGHIKVVLHVTEEDPTTLYYCLLEPSKDVEAKLHVSYGFRYPYRAIGSQLLWRYEAMRRLSRWESRSFKSPDIKCLLQRIQLSILFLAAVRLSFAICCSGHIF